MDSVLVFGCSRESSQSYGSRSSSSVFPIPHNGREPLSTETLANMLTIGEAACHMPDMRLGEKRVRTFVSMAGAKHEHLRSPTNPASRVAGMNSKNKECVPRITGLKAHDVIHTHCARTCRG